jgi:hypothetical protein
MRSHSRTGHDSASGVIGVKEVIRNSLTRAPETAFASTGRLRAVDTRTTGNGGRLYGKSAEKDTTSAPQNGAALSGSGAIEERGSEFIGSGEIPRIVPPRWKNSSAGTVLSLACRSAEPWFCDIGSSWDRKTLRPRRSMFAWPLCAAYV